MKRLYWKGAVLLVSLGFMTWLLYQQWGRIRALQLHVDPAMMAIAVAGLIVLFFLDAYGWHLIMRALGHRAKAPQNIRIWMVSSLARYLPGGVWGYLSRAALCSEQGIPLVSSSLGLYLETLLLMASSLAVGFPALMFVSGLPINPLSATLFWIGLSLLMHPRIVALTRYLPGRPGKLFASVSLPSARRTFLLYVYYLVFWILFGAVFVCFVHAIYPLPIQAWIPVGASFSMSFLVGFIFVFVPGGIGIREGLLYILLLPFLPPAASLIVSVGSRIWVILGEGIAVALAVALFRAPRSESGKEPIKRSSPV